MTTETDNGEKTTDQPLQLSALLALDEAKIKLTGDLIDKFGFESDDLILVYGAITTPERLGQFTESLCHLSDDGIIWRFGREIGAFKDIEMLEC